MKIALLAIGDEILRGETREANAYALATRLAGRSLSLSEVRVVPDAAAAVGGALRELQAGHGLIVVSGGLGPTDDDATRAAVAAAAGAELWEDPQVVLQLQQRYARFGRAFLEANRRQARFPVGAEVLENRHGTAPGFVLRLGSAPGGTGCQVACFPGVPRELAAMLDQHLDPLLALAGIHTEVRPEETLRVFGITESALQELLSGLPGHARVQVRSLPRFPEIRLAISGRATPEDAVAFARAARVALGWRAFSDDPQEPYAASVVRALLARGQTLAVAESCTGGLIGDLLTDVPGVSATLLADLVCYDNRAKQALLDVPAEVLADHGAVSEPCVRAMAEGARGRLGADWGLATSGIAGPAGGSEARPVGTIHTAVAGPGGTVAFHHVFAGLDRGRFKRLVAFGALARLRTAVLASGASAA